MIIGLDLDGVTGDYVSALRASIADAHAIPESDRLEVLPEPIDWNMSNWEIMGDRFVDYHTAAVDAGMFQHMEVYPGASEALWKLDEEGHYIHVVTSRFVTHGQNAKVISATAEWLDASNIPYRSVSFTSSKNDIYCDVSIDDSPKNIEGFIEIGRPYVIFDAPYNRHLEGRRAHNWDEAYTHLSEIAAELGR